MMIDTRNLSLVDFARLNGVFDAPPPRRPDVLPDPFMLALLVDGWGPRLDGLFYTKALHGLRVLSLVQVLDDPREAMPSTSPTYTSWTSGTLKIDGVDYDISNLSWDQGSMA